MSLPASAYTPAGGGTIQGQQTAATGNLLANASPTGSPNVSQLQQATGNATQQLADMQTPQSRSATIGNSQIPGMQSNYDDVAKQLYQYDQMHLAPQYANQPSPTSDYASFGRVGPSSLYQLTPEQADGPVTLFANDPSYAMTSQANQKNNILDVLNTLNSSISKEFTSARGKYASSVQSQKDLVNTLVDLLKNETDKQLKLADIASSHGTKTATATKDIWDQLYKTADTEDDIWKAINENDAAWRGQGIDVDQLWAWQKDLAGKVGYGGKIGLGMGEKSVADGFSALPATQKTKVTDMLTFLADAKPIRDSLMSADPNSGFLKDLITPITGPVIQGLGQYGPGGEVRAKLSTLASDITHQKYGSALTKTELANAGSWIPGVGQQEKTNITRLNTLIDTKENELRATLRANGFTDSEIDQLINQGGAVSDQELINKYSQ